MFLLRWKNERFKKKTPPPPRRSTLGGVKRSGVLDSSSLSFRSVPRIDAANSTLVLSEEEEKLIPIRLLPLDDFLALGRNSFVPDAKDVVCVEMVFEEFAKHYALHTLAISWVKTPSFSSDLIHEVEMRAKERNVKYVWIDALCENYSKSSSSLVFSHSHSFFCWCFEFSNEERFKYNSLYFRSSRALCARLSRRQALRGRDLLPMCVSLALSFSSELFVDPSVQANWGVWTAKTIAELELSLPGAEDAAMTLIADQVLKRYPLILQLAQSKQVLHMFNSHVANCFTLVLRLACLFEWLLHPDAQDSMWTGVNVPPLDLKVALMMILIQRLMFILDEFLMDDLALDLLEELEALLLLEEFSSVGSKISAVWERLLEFSVEERCNQPWLRSFLLTERESLQSLYSLFHFRSNAPQNQVWFLLCDLAETNLLKQGKWIQEVSLDSQIPLAENRKCNPLNSTDPKNYGVLCFAPTEDSNSVVSLSDLFPVLNSEETTFLLAFRFRRFTVPDFPLPQNDLAKRLQEHVRLKTNNVNGLVVFVRVLELNQCQTVVLRLKSWQIESLSSFRSEVGEDISPVLEAFVNHVREANEDAEFSSRCTNAPSLELLFPRDSDLLMLQTPLLPLPTQQHQASSLSLSHHRLSDATSMGGGAVKRMSEDLTSLDGKTCFDTQVEFPRIERAFSELEVDFQAALPAYSNLLLRNYVHETFMAQNLAYFSGLCAMLSAHIEANPELLKDEELSERFEFLLEDMGDALAIARKSGEDATLLEKTRQVLERFSKILQQ